MGTPVTLINLAGYVALLLWGTHMVQTGVQRAFGANLRAVLGAALRTRLGIFMREERERERERCGAQADG